MQKRSATTRIRLALACLIAIAGMAYGCGGSGKQVTGIQVYPVLPNISSDQRIQFSVVAFYNDGTQQTLNSTQATWSSSNTSIATIAGTGVATSLGPQGSTTIAATAAGQSNSTILSVAEPVLDLQFLGSGAGTVASSPAGLNCSSSCSVPFLPGVVTLTATPTRFFGGWSGCDSTDGLTCTVNMVSTRTVGVTFD